MAFAPQVLSQELKSATLLDIIVSLQADEPFLSSMLFREQCSHAYRILRVRHDPPVPVQLIASLFKVDHGTIWNDWCTYRSRSNRVGKSGRPTALTPKELDMMIETILCTFQDRHPLTLSEIDAGI
jgi:hypothetical protein